MAVFCLAWFAQALTSVEVAQVVFGRFEEQSPVSDEVDVITAAQLLALIDGVTVHCLVLPIEDRPALADRVLGAWIDHLTGRP